MQRYCTVLLLRTAAAVKLLPSSRMTSLLCGFQNRACLYNKNAQNSVMGKTKGTSWQQLAICSLHFNRLLCSEATAQKMKGLASVAAPQQYLRQCFCYRQFDLP